MLNVTFYYIKQQFPLVYPSPVIDLSQSYLKTKTFFLVQNKTFSFCYAHTNPNFAILFRLVLMGDQNGTDKFVTTHNTTSLIVLLILRENIKIRNYIKSSLKVYKVQIY